MRPALERPGRGGSNESSLEHFRQSVQEKINNGDKELDKARKKAREKESERERGEKDLVGLERDIDELKPETERPGKDNQHKTQRT
jgi:peptidoglycan hydrolase CwlO-like protein